MRQRLKTTLAELTEEEQKLQAVLSHISDGVIVFGKKGSIIMANGAACTLFNCFTLEEFKKGFEADKKPFKVFAGLFSKIVEEGFSGAVNTNDFSGGKVIKISCSPLKGDTGEIEGAIFLLHDITELSMLDKMRVDFVSNVSHEFKTPLASIKGFTELLLDGAASDPDDLKHFLTSIERETDRLSRLVRSLLYLSKMDSGLYKLDKEIIDFGELIRDAADSLSIKAAEKNISIEFEIKESVFVLGDDDRLRQIVINLVDNAVRYSFNDGKIKIKLSTDSKNAVMSVEDNGCGISESDLPRIFERFYRVDKSRTRNLGGSGLGLAIVKQLSELSGGNVSVRSSEGEGCCFSVVLPLASQQGTLPDDSQQH